MQPGAQADVIEKRPRTVSGVRVGWSDETPEDFRRARFSDAVNIRQTNLRPLLGRQINSSYTSHNSSLSLPLLVLRVIANDAYNALSMNDLTLIADLFY